MIGKSKLQTQTVAEILTISFFGWIVASLAADAIPVFFAACAISFCSFSSCACASH